MQTVSSTRQRTSFCHIVDIVIRYGIKGLSALYVDPQLSFRVDFFMTVLPLLSAENLEMEYVRRIPRIVLG